MRKKIFVLFICVLLLIPIALMSWDLVTGQNGADPLKTYLKDVGNVAIKFYLLNLALGIFLDLGPRAFRMKKYFLWVRRPLGVLTFLYLFVHLIFFGLNEGDINEAFKEATTKTYLILGFIAWMVLAAMAVTSTDGWVRRLGKKWKYLHQTVHIVTFFIFLHVFLIEKSDKQEWILMFAPILFFQAIRLFLKIQKRKGKNVGPNSKVLKT